MTTEKSVTLFAQEARLLAMALATQCHSLKVLSDVAAATGDRQGQFESDQALQVHDSLVEKTHTIIRESMGKALACIFVRTYQKSADKPTTQFFDDGLSGTVFSLKGDK